MDAIDLLLNRTSSPALREPAPTEAQLETMFAAAARAPDHKGLRPYRFLVIEGAGLNKLGELYLQAALEKDPELDETQRKRLLGMPLRAPMVVVAIAVKQDCPGVPSIEQVVTAGCAAHAVIQAAFAQGLGAIWRSGEMAYHPRVLAGLGCADNEEIVGFIYLGRTLKVREAPAAETAEFVQSWGG